MLCLIGSLAFPFVFVVSLHYSAHLNGKVWALDLAEASNSAGPIAHSYPLFPQSWHGQGSVAQHESVRNPTVWDREQQSVEDEIHLVLDLSVNLLYVKQGNRTLYTALASTGSGKVLSDPRNISKQWKFETPKGRFTIVNKLFNPVWVKPDWAFIEKNQPIPRERKHRFRTGVLGKYALGFGNGYYIHGAVNTFLLGFNTTHGCILINEKDLHYIFHRVPLGTSLIIA